MAVRTHDSKWRLLAAGAPPLPAVPTPPMPMAWPVLGEPPGPAPFIISIGSHEGQAGLYGLLAAVDAVVLCAAAGMSLWLASGPA